MSLDELRADLARNIKEAAGIADQTARQHLQNTLWPFLEAMLEVVDEMDDAVAELVDQQDDYLQPETAGVFAAVIQSSLALTAELRKRIAEPALVEQITQHEQLCAQAVIILGEITMIPEEGEEAEGNAEATEDDDE